MVDQEKLPSGPLKNLPGTMFKGPVSSRFDEFLQVPVVAPAGFRSPGTAELGAAPPAWSSRTGFGQPGERFRIPRAVRITGSGAMSLADTRDRKGSKYFGRCADAAQGAGRELARVVGSIVG